MDLSKNGAYGKVIYYSTSISQNSFESVDQIDSAGWHSVNDLYRIERLQGVRQDLLIYSMVGHGFLELNGTRYLLEPNTIALVPANGSAIYGTVPNCNWEFQWIHYSGVHAEACTRDILRSGKTVIHLGSKESQQIASLFAQIAQNTCLGLEKRLMEAGIIDLILHTVLCQSALPKHTGQERTLVEMITEYVETAPTLSLDELSQQFHYSKEHLVRLYKAATGMTPYKYWLVSRLKRSCIALLDHSVTIERIAADLGFTSASNFYVQFKRHYGISPGEYRQLHCIPKP